MCRSRINIGLIINIDNKYKYCFTIFSLYNLILYSQYNKTIYYTFTSIYNIIQLLYWEFINVSSILFFNS